MTAAEYIETNLFPPNPTQPTHPFSCVFLSFIFPYRVSYKPCTVEPEPSLVSVFTFCIIFCRVCVLCTTCTAASSA